MGKPENWDKWSRQEKTDYAYRLLASGRGMLVMSQVMEAGIKAMKAVQGTHREPSNISDAEIIRECVFDMPVQVWETTPEQLEMLKKLNEAHVQVTKQKKP